MQNASLFSLWFNNWPTVRLGLKYMCEKFVICKFNNTLYHSCMLKQGARFVPISVMVILQRQNPVKIIDIIQQYVVYTCSGKIRKNVLAFAFQMKCILIFEEWPQNLYFCKYVILPVCLLCFNRKYNKQNGVYTLSHLHFFWVAIKQSLFPILFLKFN